MSQQYDVIVVGAGMVGATLACALSQGAYKVALIEASEQTRFNPDTDYDLRVSAISLASKHIFKHIGVWGSIQSKRVCPYQDMHVWDANGSGQIHFASDELNQAQLGYIIENSVIQSSLHEQLQQDSLDVYWQSQVCGFEYINGQSRLTLDNGNVLSADLVVAADGANSKLRQLANIFVNESSYQQKGIVAVVETVAEHQATAWQRFLPTGPLAFLPLSDGRCSIVWSTSNEEAQRLQALSDDTFCHELATAFDYRLGDIKSVGPRAAFPLKYLHAQTYTQAGLVLVGDAAHVVHPLAGQGVNLGLLDVAELVHCLDGARQKKISIATANVLRRYERNRRGDNQTMLMSMDAINKLFSSPSSLIVGLRNQGLNCVDRLSPLKHVFMRQAMGLAVELPPLARPVGELYEGA